MPQAHPANMFVKTREGIGDFTFAGTGILTSIRKKESANCRPGDHWLVVPGMVAESFS